MFKNKKVKSKLSDKEVKITIIKEVLELIFDECDRHDVNETGGRIIGFYNHSNEKLEINICGCISSGPNALKSPTSFFQDGKYQESVFRQIESKHPNIEHIGNWHTHHVNGLNTLSSGDMSLYTRIVNHKKHNTDFLYALLIISKNFRSKKERYKIKHFITYRGDSEFYEIPNSCINITRKKALLLDDHNKIRDGVSRNKPMSEIYVNDKVELNNVRALDKQIMSEMYSDLNPFISKQIESLYWRGKIELINGSQVELLILESVEMNGNFFYSVGLTGKDANRFKTNQLYTERKFDSARKTVRLFEHDINKEIFNNLRDKISLKDN